METDAKSSFSPARKTSVIWDPNFRRKGLDTLEAGLVVRLKVVACSSQFPLSDCRIVSEEFRRLGSSTEDLR